MKEQVNNVEFLILNCLYLKWIKEKFGEENVINLGAEK